MRCRGVVAVVAAGFVSVAASGGTSGQIIVQERVGWVALFNEDLVRWLENGSQNERFCGAPSVDRIMAWEKCSGAYLAPKVRVWWLRTAPTNTSDAAGDLVVVAIPGKGLHGYYVAPAGGEAVRFVPDLFDSDTGYGPPYYHQTVVERRLGWVRLPASPFPSSAWLDTSELIPDPFEWLEPGAIVESPLGSLFILEVAPDLILAREEQDNDNLCDPKPPVTPFKTLRLSRADIYTPDGHLRLRIKYTRGC
jgi:hypothetical protein